MSDHMSPPQEQRGRSRGQVTVESLSATARHMAGLESDITALELSDITLRRLWALEKAREILSAIRAENAGFTYTYALVRDVAEWLLDEPEED